MSVQAEFSISGTHFAQGKSTVEKKLASINGVNRVSFDTDSNKVTVDYEESKARIVDIKQAIMEEGYSVIEI
jgi:copper chaperone CopZ